MKKNKKFELTKEDEELFLNAGLGTSDIVKLYKIGYFTAPASSKFHLNTEGGLYIHSKHVVKNLLEITKMKDIKWKNSRSPYLIGLLHDLVKTQCYKLKDSKYSYAQPNYPGHGVCSLMIATTDLGIRLNDEETQCIIHHMGAFNLQGNDLDDFSHAVDMYPDKIIATHMADWWSAKIDDLEV